MSQRRAALVGVWVVLAASLAKAEDVRYVKLVQANSGKVLAVADDSDEAGAAVVLVADGAGEAKQWKVEKDGDYLKVVNRKSGKVLDVFGASTDEGAAIIQWDDKADDNDNQRWSWEGSGTDRRLKSKSSGLVVAVDDDGKAVQKKPDDSAGGQSWKTVEVKD